MGGAHGMETRYPFLDNDFVNFALSLPDEYLKDKRILKDIADLPDQITKGKKRGFSNPISNKEWVDKWIEYYGYL
jgi:asparagine synthetase B (glutamine-hydrolysing)